MLRTPDVLAGTLHPSDSGCVVVSTHGEQKKRALTACEVCTERNQAGGESAPAGGNIRDTGAGTCSGIQVRYSSQRDIFQFIHALLFTGNGSYIFLHSICKFG